ncbi:uncharacterized protein [Antedon mediterranea]|uniref:uncharacterized protein n=1 Tax=Antedon mediterranea TaxID=105859 RepID=UPI003AF6BA5E
MNRMVPSATTTTMIESTSLMPSSFSDIMYTTDSNNTPDPSNSNYLIVVPVILAVICLMVGMYIWWAWRKRSDDQHSTDLEEGRADPLTNQDERGVPPNDDDAEDIF